MEVLSRFGEKISMIRKEKGYSQERFALKIGMDRTYYASIEKGKHSVSLEKIVMIAKGLDTTLESLFKDIEV